MLNLVTIPSTKIKAENKPSPGVKGKGKAAAIVVPVDTKKAVPKTSASKTLTKPLVSKKSMAKAQPAPEKQSLKASVKSEKPARPKPKSVERDPRLQLLKSMPSRGVSLSRVSRIPKRHKDPRTSSKITGLTDSIMALKRLDSELSKALRDNSKAELEEGDKIITIGGNRIKLTDESAVRSKLMEDARVLGALKRRIADLNAQNLAIEKKLKDEEKSKMPTATPVVPSSLEVYLMY